MAEVKTEVDQLHLMVLDTRFIAKLAKPTKQH